MNKNSNSTNVIIYALLGFIFGLVMVALGTVVALLSAQLPFTLENIFRIHLNTPLLWVIDSFPFFLAAVLGLLGSREGQLQRMRAEGRETQKRSAEVGRLNAELAKKDQERQEIEAVISRGKKEWEATFDSVVDMILLVDENGKILRCNRAAAYAFKLDFLQIIGTQINERFFGSETSEQMPTQKTEMKFLDLDGWYEVSSDPLTYQEGLQQGRIYIIRNITDRKQAALDLERQKQFYESLVKNSPVGIVTLSLDHRVVACNPAFEVMFGYKQQEVIGQNIDSLISPSELIDESLLLTYNVSQGEVVRKITQRRRKDGTLVDVELFGIPVVLWGKQIGILGMYHNVTDLVRVGQTEAMVEPEPATRAEEIALAAGAAAVGAAVAAEPEGEMEAEMAAAEAQPEVLTVQEKEIFAEPEPAARAEEIAFGAGAAALGAAAAAEPEVEEEAEIAAADVEAEQNLVVAPFTGLEEAGLEADDVAEKRPRRRLIKVETIEGIGPVYAAKLAEFGLITTEDLLTAGATRKGRQELVEKTGISDKLILKWVNKADLMRVPGIGEEYSDLLEAAGVDTVRELRNRNPVHLYNALVEANAEKRLVRRPPHLSEVEDWVKGAKELEPRMTY